MKQRLLLITTILITVSSCGKDDCVKSSDCLEDPEAGPCEALFTKYYYDRDLGICRSFEWGGCDGNVPFETLEECWECECSKRLE